MKYIYNVDALQLSTVAARYIESSSMSTYFVAYVLFIFSYTVLHVATHPVQVSFCFRFIVTITAEQSAIYG